jgi:hypothetical protein
MIEPAKFGTHILEKNFLLLKDIKTSFIHFPSTTLSEIESPLVHSIKPPK